MQISSNESKISAIVSNYSNSITRNSIWDPDRLVGHDDIVFIATYILLNTRNWDKYVYDLIIFPWLHLKCKNTIYKCIWVE